MTGVESGAKLPGSGHCIISFQGVVLNRRTTYDCCPRPVACETHLSPARVAEGSDANAVAQDREPGQLVF
jgi:hypothetical protein